MGCSGSLLSLFAGFGRAGDARSDQNCWAWGSVAIRVALTLPVVISTMVGAAELGKLGYTKAALQYAAEEATHYAISREGQATPGEIEDYVAAKLTGALGPDAAVIADPAGGDGLLSVSVNYGYRSLLPFLPYDGMRLSGSASGLAAPAADPHD